VKNRINPLFVVCLALDIFLSFAGQAQTTNVCDGCTISSTYDNASNNVFSIIGTNASLLTGFNTTFFNEGRVLQSGSGGLSIGGYNEDVYFNNEPGAIYQFASDSSVLNDYPGNDNPVFTNQGLIWKSAGTNYSAIEMTFDNQGGSIEVDSGTLYLNGGDSSNGVFEVASGAVLDLTGGGGPTWAGEMTGSGLGTVSLADGSINASPSLTLGFTNDLFQWDGGAFEGIITNNGIVTITSSNVSLLTGSDSTFFNKGVVVQQIGSGGLAIGGYNDNDYFNNEPGATYQFASDSSILNDYPGNDNPVFTNQGLIWKSGGTNYSAIEMTFDNQGGSIEVDSGTLYLSGGGTSSNGFFNVASGAVLDLTGGNTATWAGEITGAGSGTLSLADGSIIGNPSLTLDFTNDLFQWEGGTLEGTIINNALVTISGTNASTLTGYNATFINQGTVRQVGSGGSQMQTFDGNIFFINELGGTYEFASDSSLLFNYSQVGYGASPSPFTNYGLVWKSAGTGVSAISLSFNNLGGVVQVDSGTLVLDGGGGSSNGDFEIASGAVLDLTGGSAPTWAGEMTGSGSGTVLLGENGTITGNPSLTLDFTNNLFQWAGGTFQGTIINDGLITISGTNASTLTGANSTFINQGTVRQAGSGGAQMQTFDGNIFFINEPEGTYQFASDSSLIFNYNQVGYGASPSPFTNYGLVWKSAGTGTSVISLAFYNQGGSIEVDSGTLAIDAYAQNGGSLTIALAGSNSNQCGQVAVGGGAVLGGPLNVFLANGFVPAAGDQFYILSSTLLQGNFTSTNVPAGMTVTNLLNSSGLTEYVELLVTGKVTGPVKILSQQVSDGTLSFNFATISGQTYTIQQNTNLSTTNWLYYTNFTGNGSIMQVMAPSTIWPEDFFRVVEP
jgi:hypothetical protein